jgi:hypothetical protein
MTSLKAQLTTLAAVLLWIGAAPALAASSTASSASDSASSTVGSLSDSIQQSSTSSTTTDKVADGDYRVIEVAAAAERPGLLRITLQPALPREGGDGEFFLYLPRVIAEQARIGQGALVSARQRPYGLEFAQGQPRQAFFLVLADDWYRELQARPVTL